MALVSLVPVLAAAYGVVMGAVVLVTGWRWFRYRTAGRYRRGVRIPTGGATGQGLGGAR